MVGAVLLAFVAGAALGFWLGRRGAPGPVAVTPAPTSVAVVESGVVTKRGRKAGLTEESFRPSDDILEKLRRAAEGEIDPSEIERPPEPPTEEDLERAARQAALAEQERRVLERLRQLEADAAVEGGDESSLP